jgi:hypothetical protein
VIRRSGTTLGPIDHSLIDQTHLQPCDCSVYLKTFAGQECLDIKHSLRARDSVNPREQSPLGEARAKYFQANSLARS